VCSSDLYEQKLPDGRLFGEAILTPSHFYVNLVRDLMAAELDLHYMVNITGHGWRKLMRAPKNDLCYIIYDIFTPQKEFDLIQKLADMDDSEMYATFNMGAGFAVFLPENEAGRAVKIAGQNNLKAIVAGRVESGEKSVVIEPKGITYQSNTLGVRQ
jgi:phosphoribosylformylglycinamidine cyclo-ligase